MKTNKGPLSDDCIMTAINEARPMVYNLARRYERLEELEDLLQDIAVYLLTLAAPLDTSRSISGYLQVKIRFHCIDLLQSQRHHASIDELLTGDGYTLADTLPAPAPIADTGDEKERAVHAALMRLANDEQRYLAGVFELNSYTPRGRWVGIRKRTRQAIRLSAYRHLRRDSELGQLVASGRA